jgi:leader peptidase (prepilin peptidase)/N-methyltransferase
MFVHGAHAITGWSMHVADVPRWMVRLFAVLFGLCWGSFLNVVIWRMPREESVAHPPSHCACGKPIAPRDNIPIVSWLLLRGRARCCGAAISIRYPLVEAIGGVLTLAVIERMVLAQPLDAPILPLLARAIADCTIVYGLVAAAFIDLDHMYLPDEITLGGAVFALLSTPLRPELDWRDALLGLMIGFFGIYLPFIVGWRVLRGKQGMGLGDAKLMALVGAWMGWRAVVFTLFAGSMQGTLAAIVTMLRHGKIEEPASVLAEREAAASAGEPLDPEEDPVALPPSGGFGGARIAFGPFLILGALEFLFFGPALQRWFAWIVEP